MGDGEKDASTQEAAVLRYVRLPEAKGKETSREAGNKGKKTPIQFTAAFCVGERLTK